MAIYDLQIADGKPLCANSHMKKDHPPSYYDIRKTINMPPMLWKQIEDRLYAYEPRLDFSDWARRIFQDELKRPVRVLPDWLAQPREGAQ